LRLGNTLGARRSRASLAWSAAGRAHAHTRETAPIIGSRLIAQRQVGAA
jgi:hypothetical protein